MACICIKKYKNKPKWNKWRQQKKKTKLLTHIWNDLLQQQDMNCKYSIQFRFVTIHNNSRPKVKILQYSGENPSIQVTPYDQALCNGGK